MELAARPGEGASLVGNLLGSDRRGSMGRGSRLCALPFWP